jgi:hypothetical protein
VWQQWHSQAPEAYLGLNQPKKRIGVGAGLKGANDLWRQAHCVLVEPSKKLE